jgi:beta-phosphoglucomutase
MSSRGIAVFVPERGFFGHCIHSASSSKMKAMKSTPVPFKRVPTLNELKAGYPSLKALFFDMDGTIFNTESIHAEAMFLIARQHKIRPPMSPDAVHQLLMGKADHLVFDVIKDWEGFPKTWNAMDFINQKNANVIELLRNTDFKTYFVPEVSKLLNDARKDGMFIALVTSSEKVVTEELLKLTNMEKFFDYVLTRDDTPHVKPDPWPYLKALEVSGFEKFETMIFEDSNVGLEAATTSGSHVIKVEWF